MLSQHELLLMKALSQNGQQVNREDIDHTVSAVMFVIINLSSVNTLLTNKIGTKGLRTQHGISHVRPANFAGQFTTWDRGQDYFSRGHKAFRWMFKGTHEPDGVLPKCRGRICEKTQNDGP